MEKLNSTVQRIHERIEKNYIHLCKMLDMPKHRNKMSIAALPTVNVQCVYCTNRMLVIFCGLALHQHNISATADYHENRVSNIKRKVNVAI